MGDALEKLNVSIEEYIETDELSLEKLEYHAGEVFAMAGESPVHSLLGNNVGYTLTDAIKKSGRSCSTFNSDIKVAVSDIRFTYPDAAVVCGKIETS
jgi:Uma2 family endonuclease